jgi:hypothetical protein
MYTHVGNAGRKTTTIPRWAGAVAPALWEGILKAEGGKITLTLIMSTVALAMEGVGIAAGGGAMGLPLLALLAPAGYFGGQELDSERYTEALVGRFKKLLGKVRDAHS